MIEIGEHHHRDLCPNPGAGDEIRIPVDNHDRIEARGNEGIRKIATPVRGRHVCSCDKATRMFILHSMSYRYQSSNRWDRHESKGCAVAVARVRSRAIFEEIGHLAFRARQRCWE